MVEPARGRRHIVVDMTPLEPGGQNGGAGLVATALVREMSALQPQTCFTLLSAADSHTELASLESPNVRRELVAPRSNAPLAARRLADAVLPTSLRVRAKRAYHSLRTRRQAETVLQPREPSLLFCPFTIPTYWRRGVPTVTIVYDLQHVAYPEFFTREQRLNRQHHHELAVARSDRVVCISEYVRRTLLENTDCPPERAVAIRLGLIHQSVDPDTTVLNRLGLQAGTFVLYPANFWPHKNHRRLFEALRLCDPPVRLVCTGAPNALMYALQQAANPEVVTFAGYLTEPELLALLDASAALVYPSLYEGFGLPILEAMARGKPVLCSDIPSLREVAQECAIYFDPSDLASIAVALNALSSPQPDRLQCGKTRAAELGDGRRMAEAYLKLFDDVLSAAHAA
jgi:glycosyltransferase involved in cell wall biosynthesis